MNDLRRIMAELFYFLRAFKAPSHLNQRLTCIRSGLAQAIRSACALASSSLDSDQRQSYWEDDAEEVCVYD